MEGRCKMINKQKAINDLKQLRGLPPYDGFSNFCANDGYYAKSLERKYGMSIGELEKACGFDKTIADWQRARDSFLAR